VLLQAQEAHGVGHPFLNTRTHFTDMEKAAIRQSQVNDSVTNTLEKYAGADFCMARCNLTYNCNDTDLVLLAHFSRQHLVGVSFVPFYHQQSTYQLIRVTYQEGIT